MEIVRRLAAGESVRDLRDMRGVTYRLGASEAVPDDALELPTYEEVSTDRQAFAAMTRAVYLQTNPLNARRLVQRYGREAVVVNPAGDAAVRRA